eukprot:XP_011666503.1 PREDICTED: uncharacterized protein LOC105439336 [Strongylocentrotus purpuratus]
MPMHATRRAIDCIDPWSYNRLAEGNTALGMSSTAPASNDATQQNASPSSNQSIFDQIKSEKEKDGSLVSFIGSVIRILFGTSIVSLLMAVSLVILIAMIAIGNVWICRIFKPNTTDNSATDYCHPTLYYFAFWWNNVCYIIGIVCFFCCCCYGCLARRYATTKGAAGANSENRDVP